MNPSTIIIPVFNEEELIVRNTETLMQFLSNLNAPFEIIIVSNGSTDSTIELGQMLEKKYKNIKFFHLNKKGVGQAFKRAIKIATCENIISLDMDLSIDLNFIKEADELLKKYDIVVGSKKVGTQKRSMIRKIGSNIYIFLSKRLLGLEYNDYSMAAKAYKKNIIEKYLEKIDRGTSYVIEIIYYANKDKLKIIEIPVYCEDTRKSKFNLFHEGFYRFKNLFYLWMLK